MTLELNMENMFKNLMAKVTAMEENQTRVLGDLAERLTGMEEARDKEKSEIAKVISDEVSKTVERQMSYHAFHTATQTVKDRLKNIIVDNDDESVDPMVTPLGAKFPRQFHGTPLKNDEERSLIDFEPHELDELNEQASRAKERELAEERLLKDRERRLERERLYKAERELEELRTARAAELTTPRRMETSVRQEMGYIPRPRAPVAPAKYSGEDGDPAKLKNWARNVGLYLSAIQYQPNWSKSFSQIVSFTEGKANSYLMDFGWPIVQEEMRIDPGSGITSWSLDHIIDVFEDRFISQTAKIDAEYKFNQLKQWDDKTKKWIDSASLADEIWSYSDKLVEWTQYKAKTRLVDALHPAVATLVFQSGLDFGSPYVTYKQVQEAAVAAERGYNISRRFQESRRKGQSALPNSVMSSVSVDLSALDHGDGTNKGKKDGQGQSGQSQGQSQSQNQNKGSSTSKAAKPDDKKSNYKGKAQMSEEKKKKLSEEGRCFRCEEKGHRSADCPKNKDNKETSPPTAARAEVMRVPNRSYAEALKGVEAKPVPDEDVSLVGSAQHEVVVNDVPMLALFDTGSSHSIISIDKAKEMCLDVQMDSDKRFLRLAAKGMAIQVIGKIKVDLTILDSKESTAFLIADINESAIIGRDIMSKRGLLMGISPRVLLQSNNMDVQPIEKEPDQSDGISVDLNRIDVLTESDPEYSPSDEERERFRSEIIEEFPDVLVEEGSDIRMPPERAVKHTIPLVDPASKVRPRVYKVPDAVRPQVKEFYDQHVKAGIWVPTALDNASPLIPLTKKDGKLRPAVDLRQRNANTVKQISHLPDQDEIVETMNRSKFRATMDVKGAFQQIRVADGDLEKNGIATIFGTVLSRVALQGDLNSANTCQMMMNDIFKDYLADWLRVYVDDAFVTADTWKEFKENIRNLLQRCRDNKLDLTRKKLKLDPEELDVLGRVLTRAGIRMDPNKVTAVMKYRAPTSKKEVQKFMGLVNYNARFIPRVAEVAAPITALTGSVPFRWTSECQQAFEKIQRLVAKDVTLVSIDTAKLAKPGSKPTHRDSLPEKDVPAKNEESGDYLFLASDASDTGAASVLLVGENWWSARPVGYHSRKFDKAQMNYPVHEKELLAALEGVRHFENRLRGREFVAITDNRSLSEFLKTKEMTRGRTARWYGFFSQFAFTVEYIKGKHNLLADILSRQYEDDDAPRDPSEFASADHELEQEFELSGMQLRSRGVKDVKAQDSAVQPANTAVVTPQDAAKTKKGRRKRAAKKPTATKAQRKLEQVLKDREAEAWNEAGEEAWKLDPAYKQEFWKAIEQGSKTDSPLGDVIETERLIDGELYSLLYKQGADNEEAMLLYVPKAKVRGREVREVLMEHAHAILGHSADAKVKAFLKNDFFWPGLAKDVEAYCRSCPSCQACKPSTMKPEGLLHTMPIPDKPWQVMGLDFMGPFQISRVGKEEYDFLMVCVDHFSSEVELVPIHFNDGAVEVADAYFNHVYKLHGLPGTLVTDRDRRFISDFWQRLQHTVGTTLAMSTSYHPETNGKTERTNRTINAMMRQLVSEEQTDWAEQIPHIQFAINSAQSAATGYAPFELTRGYIPRTLPGEFTAPAATTNEATAFVERAVAWQQNAKARLQTAAAQRKAQADKHRRETTPPDVGDQVWLSTGNLSTVANRSRKWAPKFMGPFEVLAFDPVTDTVDLKLPERLTRRGIHSRVHINQTKRFVETNELVFPNRLTNRVPLFPIDTLEMSIEKIHTHRMMACDADPSKKEWHFQCVMGGKKVWLPFSHADLSDQHIAVANYLARIRVQTKDDLNASNIPVGSDMDDDEVVEDATDFVTQPSPQQFHAKKKNQAANSALSKAKQELELAKVHAEKRRYEGMNLSYKTEAVPAFGGKVKPARGRRAKRQSARQGSADTTATIEAGMDGITFSGGALSQAGKV